jgi:hypothetical protein
LGCRGGRLDIFGVAVLDGSLGFFYPTIEVPNHVLVVDNGEDLDLSVRHVAFVLLAELDLLCSSRYPAAPV